MDNQPESIGVSIIKLSLKTDLAKIIYTTEHPDKSGQECNWTECLDEHKGKVYYDDLCKIKSEALLNCYQSGEQNYLGNITFQNANVTNRIAIEVFFNNNNDEIIAVIILRNNSRDHLQKHILQLYVYNRCDYFIYLNAKTNSYVMFSGATDGTPLPPAVCEDYSSEIVKYARDFVVPEDQDRVIYEMNLERVQEILEKKDVHAFSCGVIDSKRGYTKKRLEYRYYDRKNRMILLSRTDITDIYLEEMEKQKELERALKLAHTDHLTQIYNRTGLKNAVQGFFENKENKFSMLLLDVDNFKSVNDTLGHIKGDEVLCSIASVIRNSIRSCDLVGRLGGDEFLVFVRNIKSSAEIHVIAQRVCDTIAQISEQLHLPISCSIGVASYPDDGSNYDDLFAEADRRVYSAKTSGKNQICMSNTITQNIEQCNLEPKSTAVPHSVFSWDRLGDIKRGRELLGEEVPVSVYRLLEYTMNDVLTHEYGKEEADELFRKAGFMAGTELVNNMLKLDVDLDTFITSLKDLLMSLKIGILQVEEVKNDAKEMVLTVEQDLDCSGLKPSNEVICFYDEGFISGILKAYTHHNYDVREIDCWSNGANLCRFRCSMEE